MSKQTHKTKGENRTQTVRLFPFVSTGNGASSYMDHELMTMWFSVDPMADKYPSTSPYAYCVWNPVKLVDPNGREIDPSCIDEWDQCKNEIEKKRTGASIITVPSKHSFSHSKTEVESIILR